MKLKLAVTAFACSAIFLSAQNATDFFSTAKLKQLESKLAAESRKDGGFASETLTKYGNHLTMLAHREADGSSELHKKDADVFFVVEGEATLVSGGTMVNGKTTAANEIRGTGIDGGQSQKLTTGDIIHIQPNTPHQLMIPKGHTFTYFVVKVTQ
jgi:mannose-6-phosphate isomerase-like protein (cupin superfamily)